MRALSTNEKRAAVVVAASVCIVAASWLAVSLFTGHSIDPVTTASVARAQANIGTVVVPVGDGTCHKYSYGNDTGKSTYLGTFPCEDARPKDARANLPPALRGMQDSLRNR